MISCKFLGIRLGSAQTNSFDSISANTKSVDSILANVKTANELRLHVHDGWLAGFHVVADDRGQKLQVLVGGQVSVHVHNTALSQMKAFQSNQLVIEHDH